MQPVTGHPNKYWLFARHNPVSFFNAKKALMQSGRAKTENYIAQGARPTGEGTGVLYTWRNIPIAFHGGTPTLNQMVFSTSLWDGLRANPFVKATLAGKCHFGEDSHKICDEVKIPNIACRVTDFHCDPNSDLVLGDVDLMDTPYGLIAYNLAKTGNIAVSSRGFGDLKDLGNGLKLVVDDEYAHICWDCVTFAAVPNATMSIADAAILGGDAYGEISNDLRGMVASVLERQPKHPALLNYYRHLGGSGKTYSMPDAVGQSSVAKALAAHSARRLGAGQEG